jgi:hypothetical protein
MDAQSAAHLLIAVLIVLGNIGELAVRKKRKASGKGGVR